MTTRYFRCLSGRSERGSIVTATALAIPVLILAVGLVLDGGRQMGAYSLARDLADNAARAGAQQIDLAAYDNTGIAYLDPTAAEAAAQDYLVAQGHSGSVAVNGSTITVAVAIQSERVLLPGQIVVQGNETAQAQAGIAG